MATITLPWVRNYIDGRWIEPEDAASFENIDPTTGSPIARVHEADGALVDMAVKAARKALEHHWGNSSVQYRAAAMRRIADGIEARFDDLVAAEVQDTGKPVAIARSLDIKRGALNFRAAADTVSAAGLDSFLSRLDDGTDALNYAVPKPLGVVAVVVPWNLPFLLLTWKVSFALACGNAVVVKPSEETPSSAVILAEIIAEAEVPTGVYNVVHGAGATGEALVGHPDIDGVTFTGSTSTGTRVMQSAASRVRPVSFELGGKNAAIVFADADLDQAAAGLSRSIFTNTGQVCLCTERVYIQRSIFDQLSAKLVARAEQLVPGDPYAPATTTGPLISQKHWTKVNRYYDLARSSGADVLVGGSAPRMADRFAGGFWIEPTLWTGLPPGSPVLREEIFGPAAALIPFDTEAEAVAMSNGSEYGLAAAIWTNNLSRAHRVAQQMRTGIAWVNTWYTRELRSPFGGFGMSGIGREGGLSSLHFYTQPTNVCIQL